MTTVKVTRAITNMTGNAGDEVHPGDPITDHRGDTWHFERVTRGPVESGEGRACKIEVSRVCDADNPSDCGHSFHTNGIERRQFNAFRSITIEET